MLSSLQRPIAVVAHDAGSANHIIAWVANAEHEQICAHLKGPALTLWKRAFPNAHVSENLADTLNTAKTVISGTGWASHLEHNARIMARQAGIKSIAVIDHWTNYRARFIRDDVEILPDELWVTDEYARMLAENEFPGIKTVLQPNLYLNNLVLEVRLLERLKVSHTGTQLLYVLEPIRKAWGETLRGGEFVALDFFIDNLSSFGKGENLSIKLRPHPSDHIGKYESWINDHKRLNISLDESPTLAESVAWSDVVVGCQTYALVVALAAGKRVYSSIPPWAPSCVLPQPGIVKISDLLPQIRSA